MSMMPFYPLFLSVIMLKHTIAHIQQLICANSSVLLRPLHLTICLYGSQYLGSQWFSLFSLFLFSFPPLFAVLFVSCLPFSPLKYMQALSISVLWNFGNFVALAGHSARICRRRARLICRPGAVAEGRATPAADKCAIKLMDGAQIGTAEMSAGRRAVLLAL